MDSVYWTLNGVRAGNLSAGTANQWSLKDTLSTFHNNMIIVIARDKSANHNISRDTTLLDYNLPPITNDTAVSTNRNVAKTWTLNSQSADGDTLTWTRLTSPSALSGAITGTLPAITFTPANNWSGVDSFFVRTTDGYWGDRAKIKITVVNADVPPSIVTQPLSLTRNVGQSVTFSVIINADVNPTPEYQWKHNGTNISNAKASSYSISSIALSDSGSYTVIISNSAGTATSQAATLNVNFAPTITSHPISQTLHLGQSTTFSVIASGNPVPSYIWRKNGGTISSTTGASLTIASPGIGDSGNYTVTLTNSVGSVTSDTARFYSGVKSIAAGANHSLLLKTDGTLWACGANSSGQIGDGTTIDRSTPVPIDLDAIKWTPVKLHSVN